MEPVAAMTVFGDGNCATSLQVMTVFPDTFTRAIDMGTFTPR